jgi:hypothetical protein
VKRQIIELGSDAVAPLIAFLRDLAASNCIPRFQTGEERQGQAAVEDYNLLLQREGYESPNRRSAMERVFNLTINDRLSSDVIFILGDIKSKEAVQFLIKIMEYNGTYFGFGAEIDALRAVGLDAVPYLINELREIDRKARTYPMEELQFHFVISGTIPKEPPVEEDMFEEELGLDDAAASESWDPIYARILQDAILMIFSRMKDPRTVSYLEELVKETTDEPLISSIKATIADIKAPPPAPPTYRFRVLAGRPRKD